jgi:hypothetical protein
MNERRAPDTRRKADTPLLVEVEFDYDGRRLREAIAFLLTYRRPESVTDRANDQDGDDAASSERKAARAAST